MERYELADGTVYIIRASERNCANYEVARVFVDGMNGSESETFIEMQGTYSACRRFLDSLRHSRRDLPKPRRICGNCGYLEMHGYEYPEPYCSAGVGDYDPLLIEDGHGNLGCTYTDYQLKIKADFIDSLWD